MSFQRLNCKEVVLLSLLIKKTLLGPRLDNMYYIDTGLEMQKGSAGYIRARP